MPGLPPILFVLLFSFLLFACGVAEENSSRTSIKIDGEKYTYSGLSLSTTGDYGEAYYRNYSSTPSFLYFTFAAEEYSNYLRRPKEQQTGPYGTSGAPAYVVLSVEMFDKQLEKAKNGGLSDIDDVYQLSLRLSQANGDSHTVFIGDCIRESCENSLDADALSVEIKSLKIDEDNPEKGSVAANVKVFFTDEDGEQHDVSVNFDMPLIDSRDAFKYFSRVKDDVKSASGEGGSIIGCWDNSPVDAWCFYSNGKGKYIQYSVNGNPGTLYISFNYSVDGKKITSKNTFRQLVGSCCDMAEAIKNANEESATFEISRGVLTLGGRNYYETSADLGVVK